MILGIDLGSKTMGLAISESHIIANNLETFRFENENYSLCIAHLVELNAKYNFQEIVLGYPKHMNGDVGVRAKISEDFKILIEEALPGVKVILEDERLSTNAVFEVFRQSKTSVKQRKQFKDELSAVVILQKYLDRRQSFQTEKVIFMENQEKVISLNDKVIEALKKDKSREVKISVDGKEETFIVIFTTTREFAGESRNYVALLDQEGNNLIFAKYSKLTQTEANFEFSGSLTDIEDVEEYRQLTEVFLEYMSDLEHE